MTTILIFDNDTLGGRILGRLSQWGYKIVEGNSDELDVYTITMETNIEEHD